MKKNNRSFSGDACVARLRSATHSQARRLCHHVRFLTGAARLSSAALALAALLLLPNATSAQSRQVPAPAQTEPVVIHSVTVHTVSGPALEDGYVVFDEGVITDVGRGAAPDVSGAKRIDGSGLHLYPGLISSETRLGLTETSAVDVTNDHTERGRFKPEVRPAVALNPDTDLIPVTRANGILTAAVFPSGGFISGRVSIIRMDGWTWEDMTINDAAGLVLNWPRVEPTDAWWVEESEEEQRKQIAEDLDNLERAFDETEAYLAKKDADPTQLTDLRYEAMRASLQGDHPIFVRANAASQIESAVAWAQRRGYNIIIVGGYEADQVAPLLAEHDIAVIVRGTHRLPGNRHDDYDQAFKLCNTLREAGVRFCLASGAEAAHERDLNHAAATAAAYGLPKDEALRSVTLYPAQILGLDDQLGSIEKGKAATLILTTGDPLEITTDTLVAFINGRQIDLGNRHRSLYNKYREKYRQLGLIVGE